MDAGLVPVKRLDAAKSRLAEFLDRAQRLELARAMLEDALDLCADAGFLRWFVVTSDELVAERARQRGLGVLEEPSHGDLNASLRHAIATLGAAATSITIIPVDAPLATVSELKDLVDTGALSDVVVVPAERDAGTNGLFLSSPGVMEPRFGESSFSAYMREAEARRLRCSILPLPGLGIDIDTMEDVERALQNEDASSRSLTLLRSWRPDPG